MFSRGLDITRPATKLACLSISSVSRLLLLLTLFVSPCVAQIPIPTAQPLPPGQDPNASKQGSTIKIDVGLVVLHTSVLDDRGKFVDGLTADNFRVYEDKVEQKLATFKREDVPVSMGLVIDNSGSMRDKRPRVNEAALTLVEASNKQDEAFVVNFNDDFYLDLDKDFSNSIPELKEALERIDSRGSTALFDAIIGSLDHLKKAAKDKRVLLVVTDGEDNASRESLEQALRRLQEQNGPTVYTIGLLGDEHSKRARRALREMAEDTGGVAFFPNNLSEVEAITQQIAHDIRNQYTIGYKPSTPQSAGGYRTVKVQAKAPGYKNLQVRTRSGYYAGQQRASAEPGTGQ
jgi:Ca-activated chloride channel homolog